MKKHAQDLMAPLPGGGGELYIHLRERAGELLGAVDEGKAA